jgi:hypothetical protein
MKSRGSRSRIDESVTMQGAFGISTISLLDAAHLYKFLETY